MTHILSHFLSQFGYALQELVIHDYYALCLPVVKAGVIVNIILVTSDIVLPNRVAMVPIQL